MSNEGVSSGAGSGKPRGTCGWGGRTDPSYDTSFHQGHHPYRETCINWYPVGEPAGEANPCPAKLNGDPSPTCQLKIGHDGEHECKQHGGILYWSELSAAHPAGAGPRAIGTPEEIAADALETFNAWRVPASAEPTTAEQFANSPEWKDVLVNGYILFEEAVEFANAYALPWRKRVEALERENAALHRDIQTLANSYHAMVDRKRAAEQELAQVRRELTEREAELEQVLNILPSAVRRRLPLGKEREGK